MKITKEEVLHIANLAHLKLNTADVTSLESDMSKILEFVETLNDIDTKDVEPAFHAFSLENVFREDEVIPSLERNETLSNAPERDGIGFVVPKVVE